MSKKRWADPDEGYPEGTHDWKPDEMDSKPIRPPLTQARLKALMHYNPETGLFTRDGRVLLPQKRAKSHKQRGYSVFVDGKEYMLHRLAFLYMTGEMPKNVRHANGNRMDNRWENLIPRKDEELNVPAPSRMFGTFGINRIHCLSCGYKWDTHFNAPRSWIRCLSCGKILRIDGLKLGG